MPPKKYETREELVEARRRASRESKRRSRERQQPIGIWIDEPVASRLNQYAALSGRTKKQITETALAQYLRNKIKSDE